MTTPTNEQVMKAAREIAEQAYYAGLLRVDKDSLGATAETVNALACVIQDGLAHLKPTSEAEGRCVKCGADMRIACGLCLASDVCCCCKLADPAPSVPATSEQKEFEHDWKNLQDELRCMVEPRKE